MENIVNEQKPMTPEEYTAMQVEIHRRQMENIKAALAETLSVVKPQAPLESPLERLERYRHNYICAALSGLGSYFASADGAVLPEKFAARAIAIADEVLKQSAP